MGLNMKNKQEEYVATGRRKTAVASVRLKRGSGKISVNGKEAGTYFPLPHQMQSVLQPVATVNDNPAELDIFIRVKGGGVEAQINAARLGLARALVLQNEDRKHDLKKEGFLKRDPRMKERKKYGLAGARRRFQFSKR